MDIQKYLVESEKIEWEDLGAGVKRKILAYDNNLMMVLVSFQKDAIGYTHNHIHTQVTYVANGSFEVEIEDTKKILKTGDCFFVPSNLKHGVTALEDGTLIDIFTPMREDFIKK